MDDLSLNKTLIECLKTAEKKDYRSTDISDLKKNNFYLMINSIKNPILRRLMNAPYQIVSTYFPGIVRTLANDKCYQYPQAFAMITRALITLQRQQPDAQRLRSIKEMLDWLLLNRNHDYSYPAWGQPFIWHSAITFPANIPRATVSSQVAWAFLEMYELVSDERYLETAIGICKLFINNFNKTTHSSNSLCFSYTTIDDFEIHNSNLMIASVLARTYRHSNIEEFREYALQATNFSISHINEDGSIGYAAPPAKNSTHYDNYHTGFVVESLASIIIDFPDDILIKAYEDVLHFYAKSLFDNGVPKMTPATKYPIDIQSCAQSIISLTTSPYEEHRLLANKVCDYTIKKLYIKRKKHFSYRIYRSGFKDNSYYIRWGDAWMIRAISLLIGGTEHDSERKRSSDVMDIAIFR